MQALARWCFSHRWLVVTAWLTAILGMSVLHSEVGSDYVNNFGLPNTQSAQASLLLQQATPRASGDTEQIVFSVAKGSVTAPAVRARTAALLADLRRLPHVASVVSPYGHAGTGLISRSRRIAVADLNFAPGANLRTAEGKAYLAAVTRASGAGVRYTASGSLAEATEPQGSTDDLPIGFLAAGAVLFIVFGSFLAMLLPLLTAAVSLGTGIAIVGLLSNAIDMASFSSQLALLIGLGVGIDYALFIVTRFRQARLRGVSPETAVAHAIDTSGRAVLFAGMIVCIAMLGMLALGVGFLYGVAIAATATVACTVIASLTLLPALLSLFGGRVLRRRERRSIAALRFHGTEVSAGWTRWTGILQRRPALFALGAATLMIVIALPALSMRLGATDASSDPTGTTTYQSYELLARGFGAGYNGPLALVATVRTARDRAAFAEVVADAAKAADVASASPVSVLPSRDGRPAVAVAQIYPKGSPQAASTAALLVRLRDQVIPAATAGGTLRVLVGGETAVFTDFATVLTGKLPLFMGVVALLSFLLLMGVFRSVLVPLTAALVNLLSTGAALGVVTAIFQFGWLSNLFGISSTGPIESFLPVLLFPILFGLSMDYEVFLVSRIYEEWRRTRDNGAAVSHGLAATGKTINAAASIMVLVFAAFVLGGERVISLFGIGLASAVLLDAVIVRSILVPSVMLLLGRANWHLPAALEPLIPHLAVEGRRVEPALDAAA